MSFNPRLSSIVVVFATTALIAFMHAECARAACSVNEVQQVLASDGDESDDEFGTSIAVSGTTMVVGSPRHSPAVFEAGAAYVYDLVDGEWTETQKLFSSEAGFFDAFGEAVAISGSTIMVGTPQDDEGGVGTNSGSVFVYELVGDTWIETQRINPLDPQGLSFFGASVALEGSRAVIGAWGDHADCSCSDAGAAYIFEFDGELDMWVQSAKLIASDPSEFTYFGASVALSGDTVVVGAWSEDDPGMYSGAAYVYRLVPGGWSFVQKLEASEPGPEDGFGRSVAVDGDTILVGANRDTLFGFEPDEPGSAYVFELEDGPDDVWAQTAELQSSDASDLDWFGQSIALQDGYALVGAPGLDTAGAAYLFSGTGSSWTEIAKFEATDGEENDRLGTSVAMDGETIIAGAKQWEDGPFNFAGAAYVFDKVTSDPCDEPCDTDFDGDGSTGAPDLASLLGSWGSCGGCPADLDGDGFVGAADLALLLGSWGGCG